MSKNAFVLWGAVAAIAAVSILLVYFRTGSMAAEEVLAKKGLAAVTRENVIFFGIVMPVVVGLVSFYVHRRWFLNSPGNFLLLAIGIGVILSIMGAMFYRKALVEFTILHIAHIAVFGWLMPKLLK